MAKKQNEVSQYLTDMGAPKTPKRRRNSSQLTRDETESPASKSKNYDTKEKETAKKKDKKKNKKSGKKPTRTYLDNANNDDPTDMDPAETPKEDKKKEFTSAMSEAQPSAYVMGDPRVTFVMAFAKNGVRKVMHEFVTLRTYQPKNISLKAFEKNATKNRYADVSCLDASRVVLKGQEEDYIHANRVCPPGSKAQNYICTQGPMTDTCDDFWLMVQQEKASVIVMLCDFVEEETEKCAYYYPMKEGESQTYNNIKVKCEKTGPADIGAAVLSQLELEGPSETLSITHIRLSDWQDHTAPTDAIPIIKLIKLAKKKCASGKPIIVHCSAGIGRTGTFVAIDYVNEKLKATDGKGTMLEFVKEIRKQRLLSVQSAPQYVFLHLAVMISMFQDNPQLEKTPLHNQFIQDYAKYLKKLKAKLEKKKKT
ncbi:unnamed protein product [Bursaphelenchus okinawaensis]|uniref:Protein-tyrosine phosphatase n=1 Tax=Bursaphelenchus okinawaensis TaxID=465554 RepID=A0A811KJV9_9BILA|nr:unnamed protein product [Bursaphelenchus okinawaensis]CAG9106285.1 unnamed protein product [Bursaphelenchus okinawaensis]